MAAWDEIKAHDCGNRMIVALNGEEFQCKGCGQKWVVSPSGGTAWWQKVSSSDILLRDPFKDHLEPKTDCDREELWE